MPDVEVAVTFQPLGRTVFVLPGTWLVEAAALAGLAFEMPCGGEGICGKCRVVVRRGAGDPTEDERNHLTADELAAGARLACRTPVVGPMTVFVPATSVVGDGHQILTTTAESPAARLHPAVRKRYLELPPPGRGDERPDLVRLEASFGPIACGLEMLRRLPSQLRVHGFRGTAVAIDGELIDFEPGNTEAACYGVAVDAGTTTLVAALVDLTSGQQLGVAMRLNPQTSFGDDVISRIQHAADSTAGLAELQRAVALAVNELIGELSSETRVARQQIYDIAVAGNTTMQHLLAGIDPRYLGEVPFVPAMGGGIRAAAADLGLEIHPRGRVFFLPVIGGFVGGDTVAGMLATRIAEEPEPSIMVDIGTNGEIVLAHAGRLWAASTAAGPAFEGARISCGMRATRGAIEKVTIADDLHCGVIDGAPPIGLCGSGLIDLAAVLLRLWFVSPDGRLLDPYLLPRDLPVALRRREKVNAAGEVHFVIAADQRRSESAQVALTQRDVRELQLAAGAIRAGIAILLKCAGIAMNDVTQVLIAGGFGSFIRRSNAQRIGLLPPELPHQRIRYVGNASLSGARWALLSTAARRRAEELARQTRHVELSTDPDFAMEFAIAMRFPET